MRKQSKLGARLVSSVLVLCMMVSGFAPIGGIAYADDSSSLSTSSSMMSVESGEAVQGDSSTSVPANSESVATSESGSTDESTPASSDSSESSSTPSSSSDTASSSSQPDASSDSNSNGDGQESSSVPDSSSESSSVPSDSSDVTDDSSSNSSSDSSEDADNSDSTEEGTEDETTDEFVALAVNDPESGDTVEAEVGDSVTFSATLNREDVAVTYQWQKLFTGQKGEDYSGTVIHSYAEGERTWYNYPLEDVTEADLLKDNPEATWGGIELYNAIVDALNSIGADSSNVQVAWHTPNYALDGYLISAETAADGVVEIHAEKDGELHIGRVNAEGKWEFTDSEAQPVVEESWVNIEGATEPTYTFTVTEEDYETTYRCQIEIVDEAYKAKAIEILAGQGVELTDEQKAEPQYLFSVTMHVHSDTWDAQQQESENLFEAGSLTMNSMVSMLSNAANTPRLSSDAQWIEGLNSNYEYITKDTYDRVQQWLKEGKITQQQADRYWSRLLNGGFNQATYANELDENGFPTGNTRLYSGFSLVNGNMLEVSSEWYGKTVYFRPHGSQGTGTAIKIPAYTDLTVDDDGNYVESSAGSKYKKAVTVLNPFVPDAGSMYTTYISTATQNGWLVDSNAPDAHISVFAINVEAFNADPARFLVDAEGNFRMDSIAWGVCIGAEPDLSGKAYWLLKDYVANGYGLVVGHDTMYAYAGAYYDAYGTDLDESTIDPNDGTTWYYSVNSWQPVATDPDGNLSRTRGGHFYMNQLMGSNKGNVYSGNVTPSDAPSKILSTGGANGQYGKNIQFGSDTLKVLMNGYSMQEALDTPKYRTPTNYPYFFQEGRTNIKTSKTHTNQQAAFGTIWLNYYGVNSYGAEFGYEENPRTWSIDGETGTNNFYLAGDGNFLMNQVGHLKYASATIDEAYIFANSVMYVSQRKQCEICAANQNGQETAHFVRRINSANADEVLTALQNGGSYWYPLDGCYMLTDDITLPEDWTPIEHFNGHWNSDVYTVTLNSKGTPLLANDSADGASGWNLGTDQTKGVEAVFDNDMNQTTGVARVVGDLNDLFGTDMNYAGYTVRILGEDNPKYLSAGEEYNCTVNSDSKYVISNLPCIYDSYDKTGTLTVRVYTPAGKQVTEYGRILVDVSEDFWDNDMTIPLYLGSFATKPVANDVTYEAGQAFFDAEATSSDDFELVRWEYKKPGETTWQALPSDWDVTVTNQKVEPGETSDIYRVSTRLTFNDANPAWEDYQFRALFHSDVYGDWNTYEYWWLGGKASNTPFDGANHMAIYTPEACGKLNIELWPVYAEQGADQTINEGDNVQFTAFGYALADGTKISAQWEYAPPSTSSMNGKPIYDWQVVGSNNEFGGLESVTNKTVDADNNLVGAINYALHSVASDNDIDKFWEKAGFQALETTLSLSKLDVSQTGYRFRVHFTAESQYGTKYDWYSEIGNEWSGSWNTDNGSFGNYSRTSQTGYSNILTVIPPELRLVTSKSAEFAEGGANQDLMTPDEYGQTLLLKTLSSTVCDGTAAYRATIYYKPESGTPTPTWQYMTYMDHTPREWNQSVANSLGYTDLRVSVENSEPYEATYKGESGWMAITSTMYISNAPITMYNPESWLKYYFRCVGTSTIETVKETKELAATDMWGGLSMDYAIAIWHNGVIGYDGVNNINGSTVNNSTGIQEATNGREYSDWYFPNLAIKVPTGHHVNTAIVSFDEDAGFDSRDSLIVNTSALQSLGITVQQSDKNYLILVSTTKNAVSIETWQTALRQYVGFRTYDVANYSYENVVNGTTGGGGIKWVVDEARFAGTTFDPSTGKLYKLIDFGTPTTWAVANQRAQSYDSELGMSGHLAIIENSTQNAIVKQVAGGRNVWLDGVYRNGGWYWNYTNAAVSYLPWSGSAQKTNANLYMTPDGSWSSAPIITSTTGDKTWTSGWTAYAEGNIQWYQGSGLPRQVTTAPVYIDTNVTPNPHTIKVHLDALSQKAGGAPADGDAGYGIEGYINGRWQMLNNGSFGTFSDGVIAKIFNGQSYAVETFSVPAGCTAIRASVYNFANAVTYYGKIRIYIDAIARVSTTTTTNPVTAAVVEYEPQSLSFAVTDHSATDSTVIGTNATVTPPTGEKVVSAVIKGNTKIYDGTAITPDSFVVSGSEGASRDLFKITYTTDGEYANYETRTVNGSDYQDTGAVNAARYHAKVELTQEAIDAGWKLEKGYSQLECDLVIFQRPINVYSYHNNKTYDRSQAGVINNIQMEARSGDTGVIPGDTVKLNLSSVFGYYVDQDGKSTIHNSDTNNGGNEYTMYRNTTLSDLYNVHDSTSDPYHNYTLGTETYTGAIAPRGVTVHSLYLEDPNNPRNVKSYDGTDSAVISNILIDGVVSGDNIGLEEETMTGRYETANAGETLNPDGTAQSDRMKKLDENIITADTKAQLTGNDFGDYVIVKEEYSGAICRATLTAQVMSKRVMYGVGLKEDPWHDTVAYEPNKAATNGCWLTLAGLVGNDKLLLDYEKSHFEIKDVSDPAMKITAETPVGQYDLTYVGLNEGNYSVLSNYITAVMDGTIEVYPREIRITVEDSDRHVSNKELPTTHSTFELINEDEETYTLIGSDSNMTYEEMALLNGDTVQSTVLVKEQGLNRTSPLVMENANSTVEYNDNGIRHTVYQYGTSIPYSSDWFVGAPAKYLDLENDYELHKCEWCENYYGFELGTDHWTLDSYEVRVNQDNSKGRTLDIAYVYNPMGERVQNYKLSYVAGKMFVHPELRFQLNATVPMYVCMYGYNGDGEVVEPTEYGITNYSNGPIKITDIDVAQNGWTITDKAPLELQRGELSMKMKDTQLVTGSNTPLNQEQWVIEGGEEENGVKFDIPLTCYIAGGNVNDAEETYVTKVTYTVAEYGITVPEVEGVELPSIIDGEPVTVIPAE